MLKSNKAFLLFEVLIAVIVLAVGITLVLRSFNSAVSSIKGLEDYLTAASLIEEKMFQLKVSGLDKSAQEGAFETGFKKFSWKMSFNPVGDLSINKVDLSIVWNTSNITKTLSVETYLRQPPSRL